MRKQVTSDSAFYSDAQIYLNQTGFGACSPLQNFIIAVHLSVIKFFHLTGPQRYSILGKMRSLDADVDSPKSNTVSVLS